MENCYGYLIYWAISHLAGLYAICIAWRHQVHDKWLNAEVEEKKDQIKLVGTFTISAAEMRRNNNQRRRQKPNTACVGRHLSNCLLYNCYEGSRCWRARRSDTELDEKNWLAKRLLLVCVVTSLFEAWLDKWCGHRL